MKSEHRHELKTNELERIASEWGHSTERYIQDNWMLLAVAVAVILLGAGGVVYWRSSSGSAGQQGWREFASAAKAADYGNVADKYSGSAPEAWARLLEGEMELNSGIRSSFTDRSAGRSDLQKAQENFEKLIADKATPSDVMERALFGLARAKEALPPKDLSPSKINDGAIETYQRLVTEFPISIYKNYAEARIAALKTGTAQDFYAWFEKQNPKPVDREMPKDLIPPSPDETKTATGAPMTVPPPAATKPAAGKAAPDTKPATETKPATDSSAKSAEPQSKQAGKDTGKKPAADEGPALPAPTSPTK